MVGLALLATTAVLSTVYLSTRSASTDRDAVVHCERFIESTMSRPSVDLRDAVVEHDGDVWSVRGVDDHSDSEAEIGCDMRRAAGEWDLIR